VAADVLALAGLAGQGPLTSLARVGWPTSTKEGSEMGNLSRAMVRDARRLSAGVLALGVTLVLAGSAVAGIVSSLGVAKRTVSGRSTSIVVDRQGQAVYELSGESLANLKCVTSRCLKIWSPVQVRSAGAKVPIAAGVPGAVSILRRVKGRLYQVMLDRHPLYFFAGDTAVTMKGQGIKSFGGTWRVVKAG
jgi:secreted repeat protein with Y-X4-D motif